MTPSHNHFPFARPHLHGVCAKAARLHPSSLGRAATFNHSERQRSSGTALGLRWGMYRTTCAVGTTGRRSMGGLGSTGRGCTCPGIFLRADGRDGNPFLANIQSKQRGRYAA